MLNIKKGMTVKEILEVNNLGEIDDEYLDLSKEVTEKRDLIYLEKNNKELYGIELDYGDTTLVLLLENGELKKEFSLNYMYRPLKISKDIMIFMSTDGDYQMVYLNTLKVDEGYLW